MRAGRKFGTQAGGSPLQRMKDVLVVILGACVFGIAAAAQVGTAEVQILPEHPMEGSAIALIVSGTWPDSCVPRLAEVRISGKHIVLAIESPATGCAQRPTPWKLEGTFEGLPAGAYVVTVTHWRTGVPYESVEQVIGRATFQTWMPGCAPEDPVPEPSPADLKALVRGNTGFALDLYAAVRTDADRAAQAAGREKDTNIFFSPYSISLCLAMAYAGARGETERQMAEALRFALPQDRLHPAFARLSLALAGRTGLELSIANSLWGQTGYPFLPSFPCLLGEIYGAPLREVDFLSDPESARSAINRWVEEETRERVRDLIPAGGIGPDTRLVLANAIYFKAAWLFPFPEEATRDAAFHLLDGREVLAPTTVVQAPLGYAAGEGYQAVELPYAGGETSLVILLPDACRFEEFERALDPERLAECLDQLAPEAGAPFPPQVHVHLRVRAQPGPG